MCIFIGMGEKRYILKKVISGNQLALHALVSYIFA